MTKTKQYALHNTQTGEVAYVGKSATACQAYGIKRGIITKERSNNFIHLSLGWWAIDRADRVPSLQKREA